MQRMLGNAVPSLMAEILAREIRKQFFSKPLKTNLTLLQAKREDTPPPEKLKRVPKKYYSFIGEHDDYPGEGKKRLIEKDLTPY